MARDKEIVTKTMKRVKSKDTSIEVALRKALWKKGFRYRKNCAILPGKPDIVIPKYKIAIFCDSEFFHGKDWDKHKEKYAQVNHVHYVLCLERSRSEERRVGQECL